MTEVYLKVLSGGDLPRLNHFLKQNKQGKAAKGDMNYWLESNGQIIGCLRLLATENNNCFWLRGVFITPELRGQSLGTKMLTLMHHELKQQEDKICLIAFPYNHLEKFYAKLGYDFCQVEDIPPSLQTRYASALKQNKNWLLMQKELD